MSKIKKPAVVLTGFLGSGKTTLLNKIMEQHPDLRLALIINEFGDIGLDASLLKMPGEFVEMNNGCLCCALNEDLVNTLENLSKRNDYDAVVLETSGVANALTIAWTFLRPQFTEAFDLHGIVTVVDPYLLQSALNNPEPELTAVNEQIAAANLIYLSKIESFSSDQKKPLHAQLKKLNQIAPVFEAPDTNWVRPLLLNKHDISFSKQSSKTHAHYESISIDLAQTEITLEQMEDFFDALPSNVLRAKAIFCDTPKQKYFALHLVFGRLTFEELLHIPEIKGLVLIGTHIESAGHQLRKSISALATK